MPSAVARFTLDEVLAINAAVMAGRSSTDALCPANAERVRRTRFSREDIQAAFRAARAQVQHDDSVGNAGG